jgi:hypothetical protein
MDTIGFPIKFTAERGLKKHADGSSDQYAQLLALAAQIQPGELPLSPNFGSADPVFSDEAKRKLMFTAAAFIPEVRLIEVQISDTEDGRSTIDVAFDLRN